jgi:hypothetical protein
MIGPNRTTLLPLDPARHQASRDSGGFKSTDTVYISKHIDEWRNTYRKLRIADHGL